MNGSLGPRLAHDSVADVVLGLAFAFILIALNGFFVAAEFALVKVNATRLGTLERKGDARAKTALQVAGNMSRYLTVTQLGITLASLGLGWVGEPAVHDLVIRLTHWMNLPMPHWVETAMVVLFFGMFTMAHVLFGELVPKLLAIQNSEATALRAAWPLKASYYALRPVLWILETLTNLVLRVLGLSAHGLSEGDLSEEEILGILVANATRGATGKQREELLQRVLRFSERTARQAMVPRVDIQAIPIETTGEAARHILRDGMYSRVLVTHGNDLDKIAGYLYVKDFFAYSAPDVPSVESLLREVLFVPETTTLADALRSMQKKRTHISVVVDEYGGTSGMLTLEDLLEEIVGEIRDESDDESGPVQVLSDGSFEVDAGARPDELRDYGIDLGDAPAETVGQLLLDTLERLPARGDSVAIGAHTVVVSRMSGRRVISVRLSAKKHEPDT